MQAIGVWAFTAICAVLAVCGVLVALVHYKGGKRVAKVLHVSGDGLWTWLEMEDGSEFVLDRREQFELVERRQNNGNESHI